MILLEARKGTELKFFQICEKVVSASSLVLYDVEYFAHRHLLRMSVMNEDTQTAGLSECASIDRLMTPYLEEDWVPDELVLEVSSPGVFRTLRTKEHYQRSVGKMVAIVLLTAGRTGHSLLKRGKVRGEVKAVEDEGIRILVGEEVIWVPYNVIKRAQWDPKL